jgi:hypothetical protein
VGVFRYDDCFHYYASRQRGVDVGPCQSFALAYAEDQRALEKQRRLILHSDTSVSLIAFFRSCSDPKYRAKNAAGFGQVFAE